MVISGIVREASANDIRVPPVEVAIEVDYGQVAPPLFYRS
jgi:hypothetical protein